MNLNYIYTAISWILLRWHDLWSLVFDATSDVSWILAIVFLVLTVRAVLFPVFVKQIKSQRKMQELQPQMQELREKYKHDRQMQQVEVTKLLQKEKANPLMGCLPIFLQIPVFLGLFHVLRHLDPSSESKRAAMIDEYGWTPEQFDSASHAELLGAPIAATFRSGTDFLAGLGAERLTVQLVAGILVLTMVATTYVTQRQMIARTAATSTGPQAMIQKVMLYGIPASLFVSGFIFPIGVLIYWVVQNFFSMGQQFWVLQKMPPVGSTPAPQISPEEAKARAPKPGVKPKRVKPEAGDETRDPAAVSDSNSMAKPPGSASGPGRKGKGKGGRKRKGGRI